jgi:hypothetical protein
MASFTLDNSKSGTLGPIILTATGLKPNAEYDLYLNDKGPYNYAAVHGSAKLPNFSLLTNLANAPKLKSNSSGSITFTIFPALAEGRLTAGFGTPIISSTFAYRTPTKANGMTIAPYNKIELKGPEGVSVSTKPPTITPSNPIVLSNPTKPSTNTVTTTGTRTILSTNNIVKSTDLGVIKTNVTYGTGNQTPLSEVSLFFDYIQTCYIDPKSVDGSQTVTLSDIELYFRQKPHPTNNQSQIVKPGVYVYICQVKNGVPDLTKVYTESKVRLEYDQIFPSLDATLPSFFTFKSPLTLPTGEFYGIVINFEDPQFSIWTATQGNTLVGTGGICAGAYNAGKLFRASNYLEIDNNPDTLDVLYKPLSDTDLKFNLNIYEFNTNATTIELVNKDYEFIEINDFVANSPISFLFGENLYQDFGNTAANVTFYKTGSLTAIAGAPGSSTPVNGWRIKGSGTKFSAELNNGDTIVITDGSLSNTDVRVVQQIISDTEIVVNQLPSFSNAVAKYKLTAVGKLDTVFLNPNTVVLVDSNADERIRFINDGINYVTFTAGQGYSNSDFIVFSGGGAASNGRANLTTSSFGNIVSINITNTGYGFTSTPTTTVFKSDGTAGNTSATFTVSIGSQIKSEMSLGKASISNIVGVAINSIIPDVQIRAKGGAITNTQINYALFNTAANAYVFNDINYKPIRNESIDIETYNAELLSKSLEVTNKSTLTSSSSEGKSSVIKFTIRSTNKYESPELVQSLATVYSFENDINDDDTDEYTNSGNAISRHISRKISFAKNRFAEDIRVISTMWKPLGTDVKFYARVHNSKDEEAFDDKDWTELEIKDATFGGKTYSSLARKDDYVEITYGFKPFPQITQTIDGIVSVSAAAGNTTVTGVGTSFDTDLANGDVIILYDPYFADTTYAVAVVANTPTPTSFAISESLANNSLADATLRIGKTDRPFSAFNNILNDNVVRYYSTSKNEFDTYDTLAIKIVPLSNTSYIVPRIDDIRVIGVSA